MSNPLEHEVDLGGCAVGVIRGDLDYPVSPHIQEGAVMANGQHPKAAFTLVVLDQSDQAGRSGRV